MNQCLSRSTPLNIAPQSADSLHIHQLYSIQRPEDKAFLSVAEEGYYWLMTLQKNISIKLTANRESYQVTAGPATPGIEKKVQGYPIKECR